MLQRCRRGPHCEASCPNRRPGRGTCPGRPHRHRLRPADLRQQRQEGREERHAACLALPGGQQQAEGAGRRRGGRRLRAAHKDAKVEVEYIPVDTRAQRIKAAFNDPDERARSDRVRQHRHRRVRQGRRTRRRQRGVRRLGGGEGHRPDREAVGHGGRQGVRRPALRRCPRPVLPHRRLQGPRHRSPPRPRPNSSPPRRRSTRRSRSCTGSPSAARTPTARCPSSGPTAANWRRRAAARTRRPSTARRRARASRPTPRSSATTTARPPSARRMGGNATVTAFASGKAAHGDRRRLQPRGGRGGHGEGQVRGRAAAGRHGRVDRPGLRGRQQHRRAQEQFAPHAGGRPDEAAHRQGDAGQALRRDGLPADVHGRPGSRRRRRSRS